MKKNTIFKALLMLLLLGSAGCIELPGEDPFENDTNETVIQILEPGQFSLSYKGNGATSGQVPVDTNIYSNLSTIQVQLPNTLVRTGHDFLGWSLLSNGSGPLYTSGSVITISNASVTLYAIWDAREYTILFNTDGGSMVATKYVEYGQLLPKPADPYKTGKYFGGWYKDPGFNQAWDFSSDKIAKNITLYARWRVPYVSSKKYLRDGSKHSGEDWIGTTFNTTYGIFFNGNGTTYADSRAIHEELELNNRKPIIVWTHGLDPNGPVNYFNRGNSHTEWHTFSFRWAHQNTINMVGTHSQTLYVSMIDMIETYDIRNTEIRLVGHSWGSHIASHTADKLVRYLQDKDRKILVTVTLLDPSMWSNEKADLVKGYLKNVIHLQKDNTRLGVGIKSNKKLITIAVGNEWKNNLAFDGYQFFTRRVMGSIYPYAEFFYKNASHGVMHGFIVHHGSQFFYDTLYSKLIYRLDEEKIDRNEDTYVPNSDKVRSDVVPYYKILTDTEFRRGNDVWLSSGWATPIWRAQRIYQKN